MDMKLFYLVFGLLSGSLVTWALMLVLQPVPEPTKHQPVRTSTSELMGNCLQGQQVFYRVDRGQAAETCAYDLLNDRTRFARVWKNYKTVEGSW